MWIWLGIPLVIICLALSAGIYLNENQRRYPVINEKFGWLYFIGGEEGPIKIGISAYEPSKQRLPELTTMSPVPLRIFFKTPVSDRFAVEQAAHAELAPYREHGEWFDRDAALAFASHLKGEF